MTRAALGAGCIALACAVAAPAVEAASFDCGSRWLSRTEITICDDAGLSRLDDQMARRFDRLALKVAFGQYLGLRHWRAAWATRRNLCGADQGCINAHYRAQGRFLDRLQQCLDARVTRRACLRNTLSGEREAGQRR